MISLRQHANAVRTQNHNSCAEEATNGYVYIVTKQTGAPKEISIYQPYWDARAAVGKQYEDSGTGSLGNLLNLMTGQTIGYADAIRWSHDPAHMYMQPTQAVYENAASFKIQSYRQLPSSVSSGTWITNIKTELDQGKPLIAVLNNLDGTNGQHVVLITGADDSTQTYKFKNSWGAGYGDNGYGALSYSQNTKFQGVYVIDKIGSMDFTYSTPRKDVSQLYACVLERSPELVGLDFWAGILQTGWTETQIADAFIGSPEGQTKYGAMTNAQFVDEFYLNVLGRPADAAGHGYFTGLLNNGTSRGSIYVSTINHIDAAASAEGHALLGNKTSVSMYYGIAMQMNGEHVDVARASLVGVTSDVHTVEAAKAGIFAALGW